MKSASTLAMTAILMTGLSAGTASALTLKQAASPKETPPASYKGDVFVDSRGCVYVRATVGTKVNWVPRLSRDRKSVVCGLTPTNGGGSQVASAPPKPIAPPAPAPLEAAPTASKQTTTAMAAPSGTGTSLNAATRKPGVVMSAPSAGAPVPTGPSRPAVALATPSAAPAPTVFASTPRPTSTAKAPMATVAGNVSASTGFGLSMEAPSGAPAPTNVSRTAPAAAPAAVTVQAARPGSGAVVIRRGSTGARGVGFSNEVPNQVITQGNRPYDPSKGVGFDLRAPTYVPQTTYGQTSSVDTGAVRTLNVNCPANGQTARVRVGGETVSVNCAPGRSMPTTYDVEIAGGERMRLVASPTAGQVALASARQTYTQPYAQPVSTSRVRIGGAPATATYGYSGARSSVVARAETAVVNKPRGPFSNPASDFVKQPRTQRSLYAVENTYGSGFGLAPVPGAGRVVVNAPTAPAGYRQAWDDDRLNPRRGPQTIAGVEQSQTLWSNTVPRQQVASTGTVVVSSKSAVRQQPAAAAAPKQVSASSGKRYVQVGQFNNPANAERAAARLQGLGLPGRVARTQSGKMVVIAGPYGSPAQLNNALAVARSGGFSDAYLRR